MAEENIPSEGAIPPKQSPLEAAPSAGPVLRRPPITRKPILRKPGEAAPAPVPPPPTAPTAPSIAPTPAPQGIAIPREQAAKKMTARINLAAATGQIPSVAIPPPTDDVKTIKLKPPSMTAPLGAEASAAAVQAAKAKTSRISLESAMSTQPGLPPAAPEAPKTIRLKRPSEMGAPSPAKPTLKPPTTHVAIPQPPHQTAAVPPAPVAAPPPEPEQESPDNSPTRKKTIKVKRPGAGGGPKITLNKGEDKGGEEGGADNLQSLSSIDSLTPVAAPDKVNPFFIVAAVAALIVTLNLIWVFAAQLFGPNAATADFALPKGPDVPNPPFAMTVD